MGTTIKDFNSADAFLNAGKDKNLRNVEGKTATYLKRIDTTTIAVFYHDTAVVVYHKNGAITLNNGGWFTPTTKERINTFSPARIYQKKGVWYNYDGTVFENGQTIFSR